MYGSHNEEGRTILQCAQMYDLAIANTFFENMTNIYSHTRVVRGCQL